MRKAFSRRGAPQALAAGLALIWAIAVSAPAAANGGERNFAFGYNIFVGGVKIGSADLAGAVAADGYAVRSRLSTTGIAEWVFTAVFDFRSDGRIDPAGLPEPTQFVASGQYEERTLQVVMNYVDGAPFEVSSVPPFKRRPYEIDPRAQRGALDPISAILAALTPAEIGDLCARTIPIFDGRRRYDLIFDGVTDEFERDGQQMVDCAGRMKRIAGFKPKFMKRPDFKFEIRAIIGEDGAVTPQRLTGETPVGTIAISMRRRK